MAEARITVVKCARMAGDISFGVEVAVGDGEHAVTEATKLGWDRVAAEIAARSQKHTRAEQLHNQQHKPAATPATSSPPTETGASPGSDDIWFINTSTGEAFDCADKDEFGRALNEQFTGRQFTSSGKKALTEYILATTKLSGFGVMQPAARMKFLEELQSGKYDTFKQAQAGNGKNQ